MLNYGTMKADKIHYDPSGNATAAEEATFLADLAAHPPKHLFVISHGWNNDEAEADDLYRRFFIAADNVWARFPGFTSSDCFALGIIWPSKKFDENAFAAAAGPNAVPGAAAIAPSAVDAAITTQLTALKEIANDAAAQAFLDHAIAQIPLLSVSQSAQDDFVAALASAFPQGPQEPDPGLDTGLAALNTTPGHTVLNQIVATLQTAPAAGRQTGGAAALGGAAGFNPLAAIKNAALVLANVTTYWTMKERAGVIGRTGVVQTIAKVLAALPAVKVHLIGHSFGGRLVTAAANGLPGGSGGHQAATMLLLQGAYSHYGMAQNYQANTDGIFRSVITSHKVASEIQITHSIHDIAVGLAYPIASALAHQIGAAAWINPYGGMGADGARTTPEAFENTLEPVGAAYAPVIPPNIVRNLNGDAIIGGHGDVTHDEIAYAELTAVSRS
jgi:pimeloyl-ACP methyl ester carboxylesterase